jgi:hypothetical protein
MNPKVGRIVHYIQPTEHGNAGKHRAAMIVNLPGGGPVDPSAAELTTVDLLVFGDSRSEPAVLNVQNVPQDATAKTPGTFHEPERDDAPPPAQAEVR